MIYFIVFTLEFIVLFFLSRATTKLFSSFSIRILKNQTKTILLLSFIFLPGVIIHELSHWLLASILFVRTGEIEFTPKLEGNSVKLGSVAIAKTDPLRRFLIGVAPHLGGMAILVSVFYFLSPEIPMLNWQTLLIFYLSFEIGNTMFSSGKDMEGALAFFIATAVILIILYFLGLRFQLSYFYNFISMPFVFNLSRSGVIMISFICIVDLIVFCLLSIFSKK